MPIDFTGLATTDNYSTGYTPKINEAIKYATAMGDPTYQTYTGTPYTGTKRLNAGVLEVFNGTAWVGQKINGIGATSGAPLIDNNTALNIKDSGGTARRVAVMNTGGTIYFGDIDSSQAGGAILFNASATLLFHLSNVERARLNTSGFGIGRASGGGILETKGSYAAFYDSAETSYVTITPGSPSILNASGAIRFNVAGSLAVAIDASRRVGIGVAAPNELVEVGAGNVYLPASVSNQGAIVGSLSSDNFTVTGVVMPHYGIKWATPNDDVNSNLLLSGYGGVRVYTGGTLRVRVDGSGAVAIGTSAPTATLDVQGSQVADFTKAVFTRGVTDVNFRLKIINGVSGSTSGLRQARLGLVYEGTGWNGYIDFVRGGGATDGDLVIGAAAADRLKVNGTTGAVELSPHGSYYEAGFRKVPLTSTTGLTATATIRGMGYLTTGGITIPSGTFTAGDVFTIINNSAAAITITQGASTTLRLAGTATTGNRTLAAYGIATVICSGSEVFWISGAGVS